MAVLHFLCGWLHHLASFTSLKTLALDYMSIQWLSHKVYYKEEYQGFFLSIK